MELKSAKNDRSVDDFIANIADERKREDCKTLLKLYEKITGEKGKMWGSAMVGFGQYSYTRSDNKFFEYLAIGFSPRVANLTIYNIPGYEGKGALMSKLGKYSNGKSCLYIKTLSDIDLKILEQILSDGYKQIAGKHLDYRTNTWVDSKN